MARTIAPAKQPKRDDRGDPAADRHEHRLPSAPLAAGGERAAGAGDREREEHDAEDHGPGREHRDLRGIADGQRVGEVRERPDDGDGPG